MSFPQPQGSEIRAIQAENRTLRHALWPRLARWQRAILTWGDDRWFTIAEVSEDLAISKSHANNIIKELLKAGLVEREPDSTRPPGARNYRYRASVLFEDRNE